MDLEILFAQQMNSRIPALLADGNWAQAAAYRFVTNDHFLGRPILLRLDKLIAPEPETALVYIFQRLLAEDPSFSVAGPDHPSGKAFLGRLIAYGCVSVAEMKSISTQQAWKEYEALWQEIIKSPGSRSFKNGEAVPFPSFFGEEDLLRAWALADEWNDKRYWLETKTAWYFYGWSFDD